jgi:hypothetical protein
VWLLTAWVVICAALTTRAARGEEGLEEDVDRYLGGHRAAG